MKSRLDGRATSRTVVESEASLVVRRATPEDERKLVLLAQLDGALSLTGEILVAEIAGELRAAHSLADGKTIADPFHPSAFAVELLELRAHHLTGSGSVSLLRRLLPVARRVRAAV